MSASSAAPASEPATGAALQAGADALADLARLDRFFEHLAACLADKRLVKLVLGKPRSGAGDLQKILARPLVLRGEACLSLVYRHATKDITKNPAQAAALAELRALLGTQFSHAHLFSTTEEWQLMVSKRGKVGLVKKALAAPATAVPDAPAGEATGHDRQKQRWLTLDAPFLEDLGVTDAQHRLVPAMARKWKQINKFIEVLDHAIDSAGLPARVQARAEPVLRVVDFGSGKGYLTFATHHHLSQSRGLRTETRGVDLKADMIALCNAAAERRGMAGLQFLHGDVRSHVPEQLDVMIALHACDVATDYALHTGIRAGAAVILSSPCCHKQIRPQLQMPELLKPMLQHGIHLGQQAEMLTDSLRALLLESQGYDAQVFEFVALEHTSKNKMILALRRPEGRPGEAARRATARAQIAEIKAFYGLREHCLESLLQADAADAAEQAQPA